MDTSRNSPKSVATETEESRGATVSQPSRDQGVYHRLMTEGWRFQFAQAVRLLELRTPEAPAPGETADYGKAPIHLVPSADLVFPATDVKRIRRKGDDEDQIELLATFLGLYGIDSPLPYYFYEQLAQETKETTPHREFLDIFNHRLYSFFYRAWKKYRPRLHYQPGGCDRHSQRFVALAGVGTPHTLEDVPVSPMRLAAQAGVLGRRARNAEGLEAFIEAFFTGIEVEVVENVPRWVSMPSRSGLGDEGLQLGEGATIGEQVYDRSGKFRLQLGPMDVEQYLDFLPGGEKAAVLRRLIRLYVPDYLDYDLKLTIRSENLPTTQLGEQGAQLGFTTSLGAPTEPITSRVVDYD